jgi:glycosyltransferase involved in cell wall biosynthesis
MYDERLIKLRHPVNRGKGAAVRTAAAAATGDYVMPFDADLEYQPEEIPKVLDPVLRGEAEVVYGSRTFGSHSAYSFWYVMGNKGVTTAANILFNAYIGDLLQAHAPGVLPQPEYQVRRLRHGGRDHRQAAGAADPPVRGADHLPGAQP